MPSSNEQIEQQVFKGETVVRLFSERTFYTTDDTARRPQNDIISQQNGPEYRLYTNPT